ncbi:MAG TPA: dTDP-4-dehydrorhamnose reductase [Vicinamibacterales bacterium]|nr:dTDP-4-dehydrorhamnose reductase [Vicinamibacterales bacterium]
MKLLALVVGAGGQLGEAMRAQLGAEHELASFSRRELDVSSVSAVRDAVQSVCPDVIINCAAYTNVDAAEREPERAIAANAWGVRALARAAAEIDAVLVHFSTDFVFDGATDRPYLETDAPNPRGVYAVSKLLGEWMAADAPRHYVLRVESLFGGPHARSSVDKILDGILAGTGVRAFSDRTVSPSYVEDVVSATSALLTTRAPFGVYHCVNTGWTTWAGLARELAEIVNRPGAPIAEVPMADAGLTAPRPKFAALSNAKLAASGITMPTWQDALRRYVAMRSSV